MNRIPYARHSIDDADIEAVCEVLKSDWLTTGPKIDEFESAVAAKLGCRFAVAVNSGTAALHCAVHAANIGPGDEVIVPAITFAATSNAVLYLGARPVFADVLADSLLIDPEDVLRKITPRTKAIIAVDYAGAACDYAALRAITDRYRLTLIADACHSLGGKYRQQSVGQWGDLNCFSMHPVKPITSGEGGFITCDSEYAAARMRSFRNHGIDLDFRQRERMGSWSYAMTELGFNYRLNDLQAALALSQLRKLEEWTARRNEIALWYRDAMASMPLRAVTPLKTSADVVHAYHLFVVRWNRATAGIDRDTALGRLRQNGIFANVHYQPVYLHPYYQRRLRYRQGTCPIAENAAREVISLPMFPGLQRSDVDHVVEQLRLLTARDTRAA